MTAELSATSLRLKLHRTDGHVGTYVQHEPRLVRALVSRLNPDKLFSRPLITLGTTNPFTVINTSEICWIEVESDEPTLGHVGAPAYRCLLLESRQAFEEALSARWMRWTSRQSTGDADHFEALVELNFKGGTSLYVHLHAQEANVSPEVVFSMPAIVARRGERITGYLNPKALLRCRVYHNHRHPELPDGLWFAEAEDI